MSEFVERAVADRDVLGAVSDGTLTCAVPASTPVAARFDADGEAAGSSPAGVIACGVALADGSVGAVVELSATAVASSACPRFHQAQRLADWQPASPAIMPANNSAWITDDFISLQPRHFGVSMSRFHPPDLQLGP
jgi:hypothetical protein